MSTDRLASLTPAEIIELGEQIEALLVLSKARVTICVEQLKLVRHHLVEVGRIIGDPAPTELLDAYISGVAEIGEMITHERDAMLTPAGDVAEA